MGLFNVKKGSQPALPQHGSLVSAMKYTRKVAIVISVGAFVFCLGMGIYCIRTIQQAKDEIYVLNQKTGDVMAVKKSRLVDHRDVEVRANAELFVNRFFSINPTNWRQKTDAALEMGDRYIYAVYSDLTNKKWFEQIRQLNIFCTPTIVNYKADLSANPYKVEFDVEVMMESQGYNTKIWYFHITCLMREMDDRTEATPHALFIQRFSMLENNAHKEE